MVRVTWVAATSVAVHLSGASTVNADETITMLQLREKREVTLNQDGQQTSVESAVTTQHLKQLAFVENLARSMVGTDGKIDDPAEDALGAIDETLSNSLTLLDTSHDTDQSLLNTLAGRVTACHNTFLTAESENSEAWSEVTTEKTRHKECRDKLTGEIDKKNEACDDLDVFVGGLQPPTCQVPDEDLTVYWRNYKNYHDNNYDTWKEKKDLCDQWTGTSTDTDTICDGDQADYETGLCALRLAVVSSCETYESCFSVAQADFISAVQTTAKQASQRKVEFIAVNKIKCYIDAILNPSLDEDGKFTMEKIDACVATNPDVSKFNLIVPSVPEPKTCDVSNVVAVPCNDAFLAHYESMPGLVDCQACPDLPSHLKKVFDHHAPNMETDDGTGWIINHAEHNPGFGHLVEWDGKETYFMGAFDNRAQTLTKTFSGLGPGCTYKFKVVIDAWASVDNERMTITINNAETTVKTRHSGGCEEWQTYPYNFGAHVGSGGSANTGWPDCYKEVEMDFLAPDDGEADVKMYFAIDQGIGDEGWGWHDMRFERVSCPVPVAEFEGACTCTLTADNDIDEVYIDGVDVTHTIEDFTRLGSWPTLKTMNFDCSEHTRMAVKASDAEAGCANGGFGLKCTSTNIHSPWHGFEADGDWKAWGTTCATGNGRCHHPNGHDGADKQEYSSLPADNWFAPDYDDSAWSQAAKGNGLAMRVGASTDICSSDGPAWLFRSPPLNVVASVQAPVEWVEIEQVTLEASSSWSGSYMPDNMKTPDTNPWHCRQHGVNAWIKITAPQAVTLTGFRTKMHCSWDGSSFRNFEFQYCADDSCDKAAGRNDGGWQTALAGEGANQDCGPWQELTFPPQTARNWRLWMDNNWGYGWLSIEQLELQGAGTGWQSPP